MFKYIIWDFDGTLHDTYPGMIEAFENALVDLGVDEKTENVFKEIKLSVGHAVQYFAKKHSLAEKEIRAGYVEHGKKLPPDKMGPYPDARQVCGDFKRSGGRNFIYTHRNEATFEYLKHHGMLKYFDDVVTSEHGFVKPNPDGFLYIIEKYDLKREEGLGVGDRDLDIIASQKAGIKACLIDNDGLPYESKPEFVVKSLSELNKILGL